MEKGAVQNFLIKHMVKENCTKLIKGYVFIKTFPKMA